MRIFATLLCFFIFSATSWGAERPNIVYILCDDLGYGDIHCLAPKTSKISTVNADLLAKQGMVFTDAHSGSSVCTPTRYGIMTGRYSWRTRLQKGVVTGFSPSLIAENRATVAGFLKSSGYHTAIIGKWHLDFDYVDEVTGNRLRQNDHKLPPIGALIPDGPTQRGFDYFHGFHHARNMKAVIENNQVIEHDDEINMLPRLTQKAKQYIDSRSEQTKPFFLYLPLGSPHTPIVPTPQWQGKSGLGDYGDFVMQTDHVLGVVMTALENNQLMDNTLIIFTSDNGCSKAAGIANLAAKGHQVSASLRGSKADIWDGGHRVPMIVRWPGNIKAASTSQQLICLTDLFATAADIIGTPMPENAGEDSVSFLPAMRGQPIQSNRVGVVHHSISGHFAYRMENWKLILARGSGGWTSPNEKQVPPDAPKAQLYNMSKDPAELNNLYLAEPDIAEGLLKQLQLDISKGRSTIGPPAKNDVDEILLWKSEKQSQATRPRRQGTESP